MKEICEGYLVDKLKVNNALSCLLLANKHSANYCLKPGTLKFIAGNMEHVMETEEWKDMEKESPDFALGILKEVVLARGKPKED